ncbi:hypothetical protein P3T27_002705 [Kitasatospora sp. MAA19]|uniref:hypothetical protein n=1 Tax=unclassified Kitasatospora TaxID=2633591 RepID=UPI0024762046|nr:hypothetical protein [Kitasatospora sp. MAA19]MDH6705982.1 hypothetical protein [Kitasatospora sp. MAA19]
MNLEAYVGKLRQELTAAAESNGPDAVELTERLLRPMEAAVRLTLLDALSDAAEEITTGLAPGSVDLRLRKGVADFVVTPPPQTTPEEAHRPTETPVTSPVTPMTSPATPLDVTDGAVARMTLRLPEPLKARVEQEAGAGGLSTNAWIARTLTDAIDQLDRSRLRAAGADRPGRNFSGWVH